MIELKVNFLENSKMVFFYNVIKTKTFKFYFL